MLNNAGSKIRDYANIVLILIAICAALILLLGMINGAFFTGLISAVVFLIAGYIGCLFLSAFGELVENSSTINGKLRDIEAILNRDTAPVANISASPNQKASASDKKAESIPVNKPANTHHQIADIRPIVPAKPVVNAANRGKVINGEIYIPTGFETIICPWCETEQPSGGEKCTSCGEKFNYVDK